MLHAPQHRLNRINSSQESESEPKLRPSSAIVGSGRKRERHIRSSIPPSWK